MPVQPRAGDTFTRENILLGFSQIEFTPSGSSTPVPLGILSAQALQKVVETIKLERGDSGTLTVDREIVSRIEPSLAIETFNLRSDVAQYIFGSDVTTAVTADAAAAITNELVTLDPVDTFNKYLGLSKGDISEASVALGCATITSEAVGTGDGIVGGTQGDFSLDFKIKIVADVTSFLVNGVEEVSKVVLGSTPTANQIAIEEGEEDSITTGSGAITFGSGEIPAVGAAIVVTYTPSFTGADFTLNTDFQVDPFLGRLRFLHGGADASPFRLTAPPNQVIEVDYTYDRKSHVILNPFRQNSFDGTAVVRHLPDVGVNLVWTIPSATIRVTDDELTFGADDLATGALQLNINDAGGSDRFGTMEYSSEPEQLA